MTGVQTCALPILLRHLIGCRECRAGFLARHPQPQLLKALTLRAASARLKRGAARHPLARTDLSNLLTSYCQPQDVIANRFERVELLAEGRLCDAYLAYDRDKTQPVVMKVVEWTQGRDQLLRNVADLRLRAGGEGVPHLIAIEADEKNRRLYFIEELLAGGSLDDRLADRTEAAKLTAVQAAAWILGAIRGLSRCLRATKHAHLALGPTTLLFPSLESQAAPVVSNFGFGECLVANLAGYFAGFAAGPFYLAPEVLGASTDIGPAADVFALGVILSELLHKGPFLQAGSLAQALDATHKPVLERHTEEVLAATDAEAEPFKPIVRKCLAHDPGERYATVDDLAKDLRPHVPASLAA